MRKIEKNYDVDNLFRFLFRRPKALAGQTSSRNRRIAAVEKEYPVFKTKHVRETSAGLIIMECVVYITGIFAAMLTSFTLNMTIGANLKENAGRQVLPGYVVVICNAPPEARNR